MKLICLEDLILLAQSSKESIGYRKFGPLSFFFFPCFGFYTSDSLPFLKKTKLGLFIYLIPNQLYLKQSLI